MSRTPRGFDEWLSNQGVEKEDTSLAILREYKERFGQEQKAKLAATRSLLEALTR